MIDCLDRNLGPEYFSSDFQPLESCQLDLFAGVGALDWVTLCHYWLE